MTRHQMNKVSAEFLAASVLVLWIWFAGWSFYRWSWIGSTHVWWYIPHALTVGWTLWGAIRWAAIIRDRLTGEAE